MTDSQLDSIMARKPLYELKAIEQALEMLAFLNTPQENDYRRAASRELARREVERKKSLYARR